MMKRLIALLVLSASVLGCTPAPKTTVDSLKAIDLARTKATLRFAESLMDRYFASHPPNAEELIHVQLAFENAAVAIEWSYEVPDDVDAYVSALELAGIALDIWDEYELAKEGNDNDQDMAQPDIGVHPDP